MISEIVSLIILFISMIIQVIIPPIPAELIVIGAGNAYGILVTTLIAGTGLWAGSLIVYYFGSKINKRFAGFFNKRKVRTVSDKIIRYQTPILWIRILPYNPSDLISYAAGIIKFDRKKFTVITFFTSYSRCFALAWMGATISTIKTLFVVLGLLLLSSFIAYGVIFTKK